MENETKTEPRPRKVIVSVDPAGRVGECFSCKAPVRWGKTSTGRVCPADAEPIEGHWYSHFETCKFAKGHSKRETKADNQLASDLRRLDRWNKGAR